jgi:flagellar operon protein
MTKNSINPILLPQVQGPPKSRVHKNLDAQEVRDQQEMRSEFQKLLQKGQDGGVQAEGKDDEVEFSAHAMKRIQQRNLGMDNDEYMKIKGAIEKLRTKGGQDSLVVTGKAAYIVDVANGKIVTAMDKEDMAENVFTKIDSTLFVN